MATLPEAKEYMATLHFLFDPHCRNALCHKNHFDPGEMQAAWRRLGELGTEEVFKDLDDDERVFFWVCAFAYDQWEHIMWLSPSDMKSRMEMLWRQYQEGHFDRFLARLHDEAHDPVLEDDEDEYVFADD